MTITIGRIHNWHKPYYIRVNNIQRQVKQIHVYENDSILFTTYSGWFSAKEYGDLESITLEADEIKLKRKLKLDGSVFVMTVEDWKEKMYDLYIPNSLLEFKHTKRVMESHFCIYDYWYSDVIKSTYRQVRNDLRVDGRLKELETKFNDIKSDFYFRIENENTNDNLGKLHELKYLYDLEVERIKKIDINSLDN